MSSTEIIWDVPEPLYQELIKAQESMAYPDIIDLVSNAVQRYLAELDHESWQQEFQALQKQVRATGGFKLGSTKEEVIESLRQQRREIFESDYADMYR